MPRRLTLRSPDLKRDIGPASPQARWKHIPRPISPHPPTPAQTSEAAHQAINGLKSPYSSTPNFIPHRFDALRRSDEEYSPRELWQLLAKGELPSGYAPVWARDDRGELVKIVGWIVQNEVAAQEVDEDEDEEGSNIKDKKKVHWAGEPDQDHSSEHNSIGDTTMRTSAKRRRTSSTAFRLPDVSWLGSPPSQFQMREETSTNPELSGETHSLSVEHVTNELFSQPGAMQISESSDSLDTTTSQESSVPHRDDSEYPTTDQTSSLAASEAIRAELEFLGLDLFDPKDIRPVSDLTQIFSTTMNAFGEPGTGLLSTSFVPPSLPIPPSQPSQTPSFNSTYKIPETSFLYEEYEKLSAASEMCASGVRNGQTIYTTNRALRSRHLDIELLRVRIPHRTLLSYNLDPNARRDAIDIGSRNAAATAPVDAKPIGRRLSTSLSRASRCRTRKHIGSGMFNSRSGNRRRNSDPKAWRVGADGQRKRRRESDVYEETRRRDQELRKLTRIQKAIDEENLDDLTQIVNSDDGKGESSAQWSDLLTWRLVKLSAVVEVEELRVPGRVGGMKKEEIHVSWWAVPERAVTGMF